MGDIDQFQGKEMSEWRSRVLIAPRDYCDRVLARKRWNLRAGPGKLGSSQDHHALLKINLFSRCRS